MKNNVFYGDLSGHVEGEEEQPQQNPPAEPDEPA